MDWRCVRSTDDQYIVIGIVIVGDIIVIMSVAWKVKQY
jgi:hypothetical protein